MSRSCKKSPFVGLTTAEGDKSWKQQSARQLRRASLQMLAETLGGDTVLDRRSVSDA
jgi:hypothetical protein